MGRRGGPSGGDGAFLIPGIEQRRRHGGPSAWLLGRADASGWVQGLRSGAAQGRQPRQEGAGCCGVRLRCRRRAANWRSRRHPRYIRTASPPRKPSSRSQPEEFRSERTRSAVSRSRFGGRCHGVPPPRRQLPGSRCRWKEPPRVAGLCVASGLLRESIRRSWSRSAGWHHREAEAVFAVVAAARLHSGDYRRDTTSKLSLCT